MTRSKLSDSDKHEILHLYRTSEETTSALAERYGVSGTTIRRVLKESLSQQEYEILTNQKQVARWSQSQGVSDWPLPTEEILNPSSTVQTPSSNLESIPLPDLPLSPSSEAPSTPSTLSVEATLPDTQLAFHTSELSSTVENPSRKRSVPASTLAANPVEVPISSRAVSDSPALDPLEEETTNAFELSNLYSNNEQPEDFKGLEELDNELEDLED
ncbi:MAG TPA: hypothetical protein V6D03_12025, partial [Candidatus Caenarcaniphilales bacterium]